MAIRQKKPIRVFYSELTGRFYASKAYTVKPNGIVIITGDKFDVTNDIGYAVLKHEVTFSREE